MSSRAHLLARLLTVGVGLASVVVSGCGQKSGETTSTSSSTSVTTAASGGTASAGGAGGSGGTGVGGGSIVTDADCNLPAGAQSPITLTEVASGFGSAVFLTHAGDDRLFVHNQAGQIYVVQTDGTSSLFLDVDDGDKVRSQGERGLLGIAFHPDYADNGRFFVHYSGNPEGETIIEEYRVSTTEPNLADPVPVQTILTETQPLANHNGGSIEFEPYDRHLYIGLGDGGGVADAYGNGQNKSTILGALLRIDVDEATPYKIPPGNIIDGAPEIFDWGLRNPYPFDFDPCTGLLGDVGQDSLGEVNISPPGVGGHNWGWPIMEGKSCFEAASCNMSGLALPAIHYGHGTDNQGRSVTGGTVYRGSAIPWLRGAYLYADFNTDEIWMTRWDGNTVTTPELISTDVYDDGFVSNITAIGQDRYGELYLVSLTGTIYRIVPE